MYEEMRVVFLALSAFKDNLLGHSLVLMSNNSMVVAYLNKEGHSVFICLQDICQDYPQEYHSRPTQSSGPGNSKQVLPFFVCACIQQCALPVGKTIGGYVHSSQNPGIFIFVSQVPDSMA